MLLCSCWATSSSTSFLAFFYLFSIFSFLNKKIKNKKIFNLLIHISTVTLFHIPTVSHPLELIVSSLVQVRKVNRCDSSSKKSLNSFIYLHLNPNKAKKALNALYHHPTQIHPLIIMSMYYLG